MPITLTCPSCGQQCAVKEEYAGMQVKCPRCPGVITVPPAGPAAVVMEPMAASPAPVGGAPPPPMPGVAAGPSFMTNLSTFLAANGVGAINQILLYVGVGCMAFFLITVLLPWFGGGSIQGFGQAIVISSVLGITTGTGILYFLLVLACLFLLVFSILMNWSKLFDYGLMTASNLAIFIALSLLTSIRLGAWGLFISLVVMLAAAATLGVVAFTKVFGTKPV
jgi:hypothetical protein